MEMLQIRPQQMEVFDAIFRKKFEERMLATLRQDLPDVMGQYPPDEHVVHVRTGIETARKFGFVVEADVFQMIVFHVALGPDYLKQPRYRWIVDTLNTADLEPHVRLMQIRNRLEKETSAPGGSAAQVR